MTIPKIEPGSMMTGLLIICVSVITYNVSKSKWQSYVEMKARSAQSLRQMVATRKPTAGTGKAAVVIIEFSDYECPFCKVMEPRLQLLIEKHPGSIDLYRYDFPLEAIHPFARAAANAADCAAKQGVTEAYQRRLFEQKTFEGFDWVNLARTTGVPDVNSFRACLAGDQSANVIRLDVEEGKRLKVASTPTIIINGEILHGAVTSDQLEATYTDALRRQPSR